MSAFALLACAPENETYAPGATWLVSDTPSVTIGSRDGDAPYLFESIVAVEVTSDGRIVVADAGANAVRVYSPDGEFLWQFGRRGDGPGEFRSLRDVWIAPGDTIGAWDSEARRLTYFAGDGGLRTASIDPAVFGTLGHANLDLGLGALADGSVVLGAMSFGSPDWTGTDRIAVLRFSPDGRYLGQIGEGTGLVRKQFEGNRKAPTVFSPYPYFAVRGASVFHIRGGAPTVQVWSPDAVRDLTFPVVEHDVETAWTDLHDSLERANAEYFLALYPHVSIPETAPQLGGLLVDVDGRVWTKRYDPSRDSFWLGNGGRAAGGTWWVADAEGRVLATAQMPASFSPFQVLADRVVGVGVDSLGVQRVEVRRLSIPN